MTLKADPAASTSSAECWDDRRVALCPFHTELWDEIQRFMPMRQALSRLSYILRPHTRFLSLFFVPPGD